MAVDITLTDSAESTADSASYTFSSQSIGAAAADRDVVVGVHWTSGSAVTLTSATIAGTAATIDVQQGTDGAGNSSGVAIIRARVPSGTTAQIIINLSATTARAAIDVYRVTGAETTLNDTDSAGGTTSPQNISLSVPAVSGAIAAATVNDLGGAGAFSWTGLTEDTDRTVENNTTAASSAHDEFGSVQAPLAVQADASGGASDGLSMAGVSFAPSPVIVAAVASASGSSTVTGAGLAEAFAVGAASGQATVSGVGEAVVPAVASASGTAAVTGVGVTSREGVGIAAGTSTAAAFASLLHITNTVGIQKPVNAVLAGQQRMTPGNPGAMSKALLKSIFRE